MMTSTPQCSPTGLNAFDAVVIGAGHNGLMCAAYLARAGLRTALVEARDRVGGTADSEPFAGATVNICNCDHLSVRATPIMEELRLGEFGLRYLDVEPSQFQRLWHDTRVWSIHHDLDATLDGLAATHPSQVEPYRRYAASAVPVARMILDAAAAGPPSASGLVRRAWSQGPQAPLTLLRWSRRSALDVLRDFFDDESLIAPAMGVGPVVWGAAPTTPGTGLASLAFAMKHAVQVGRPEGGSGMLPQAVLAAFEHHGGILRTGIRARSIQCAGSRVIGVGLDDGSTLEAPVVVVACDPRRALVEWLANPPSQAYGLIERWRSQTPQQGYESKLDVVVNRLPAFRDGHAPGPTTVVAPSVAELAEAHRLLGAGRVAARPVFLVNVPTAIDPSMAPLGHHVVSIEVLYTPYRLDGGWTSSPEPQRWLELFATLLESGFLDSIVDWRAMTPDRYEQEFHLPQGHAASFAGGPLAALRATDRELTRYTTPIEGLYLTGAATFPGAGVWGASGRNAALTVLGRV